MNHAKASLIRPAAVVRAAMLAGCLALGSSPAHAQTATTVSTNSTAANKPTVNPEADKAWRAAQRAAQTPAPPVEWREKRPSPEEIAKFYAPLCVAGANAMKDFYTRFPEHPKAAEAKKKEYSLLTQAVSTFSDGAQGARLALLDQERLNDPKLSEDERFALRLAAVQRTLRGLPDTAVEAEKGARALVKDFPKRAEPYQMLLMIASSDPDKSVALAKEIAAGDAPDEVKKTAQGLLKKSEALGKPLNIKFAALDGRNVDLVNLKGKVVLIDFWATWCGPCVAELPHVKEAYAKLHDQGFEIVGISFDQEKDALEKFVSREKMPWPQYFDGKGWENSFGQEFGIRSIPTMWLVDKQGNLHDMEARGALETKVAKLLAE